MVKSPFMYNVHCTGIENPLNFPFTSEKIETIRYWISSQYWGRKRL